MTKKIFVAMMLAIALIVAGGAKADAAEVYVGRYSDGTAVYLLTHTISPAPRNTSFEFTCSVRAGRDYIDYGFERLGGRVGYCNSEGYRGYIDDGQSPVAANIYRYVKSH